LIGATGGGKACSGNWPVKNWERKQVSLGLIALIEQQGKKGKESGRPPA